MDRRALKAELAARAQTVESYLAECLHGRDIPEELRAAMAYSLQAGGKRLRPVLCLAFAQLFGLDGAAAMPVAAAFELIHTYSLVHDDLPAMDNDDLRRGKPSNHKVFGEALAILAGDGLLTEAFTLAAEAVARVPAERVVEAVRLLAQAAGAGGMVGGQALDMAYTGRAGVGLEEMAAMHARKTGALIRAAGHCGAVLAGADSAGVAAAVAYGRHLGLAFQIVDDILDVIGDQAAIGKPVGSDQAQGKSTYPSLLGLEESRRRAEAEAQAAVDSLAAYTDNQADFLRRLAQYVVIRLH